MANAAGLCLEVTPSGSKLWRFRYRFGGKAKMMGLGAYPTITLAKARERREDARRLLAEGIDPTAHKQAEKTAQSALAHTFEELAREWYAYNSPRWATSTASVAVH
jgi:hypothetical protein